MTEFGGAHPQGAEAQAWLRAMDAVARLDAADCLLFSVLMWNAGVPYILKQLIDVVSQPGTVFGVDPESGYTHLWADRGKKAVAIDTSAVWDPHLGPNFGKDFQSAYFSDWLRWAGIHDVSDIGFHPTLTGDAAAARATAHEDARRAGQQM